MSTTPPDQRIATLETDVAVLTHKVDGLVTSSELQKSVGEIKDMLKGVSDSVLKLDGRVGVVEARATQMATREEVHKELHSLTWRVIGSAAALAGAVYFIATRLH